MTLDEYTMLNMGLYALLINSQVITVANDNNLFDLAVYLARKEFEHE